MPEFIKVSGTGKADYGSYKPRSTTRSGRNTQQPRWLVQQRVEESDRIKKMKPEERLRLLKKTLGKSTALTEKLLRRLDKEWDDVYQKDSDRESEPEEGKASTTSSRRNSSDSIQSLESIERVLSRGTRNRRAANKPLRYRDESSDIDDSEDDDDSHGRRKNDKKRMIPLRNAPRDKRARVNYKDKSSDEEEEEEEEEESDEEEGSGDDSKQPVKKEKKSNSGKKSSSDEGYKLESSSAENSDSELKNGKVKDEEENDSKSSNGKLKEEVKEETANGDDPPECTDGPDKEDTKNGIKDELKEGQSEEDKELQKLKKTNHALYKMIMEGLEFATKKKKSVEEEEGPRKVEWDPNEEDTFNPLANREGRMWEGMPIPPEQPLMISGGIMKDYQIEGMIWMTNLRKVHANGILADEMGLGKTLQTISLFCHTVEVNKMAGPFLVIAPLSTLLNWKKEVNRFAPGVPVKLLYPAQKAVEEWDYLHDRHPTPLGHGRTMGTIYVTSYETAVAIRSMLKTVEWTYVVVDEGHRLKNRECRLATELRKIKSKNRMLLTGTPLQNDMEELWALLSYLQPDLFNNFQLFSDLFDARKLDKIKEEKNEIIKREQKNSILAQIHGIIAPFILRRRKNEVDFSIMPKKEVIVYCPFTQIQRNTYNAHVRTLKNDKKWAKDKTCLGGALGRGFQMGYFMDLRHACNHPYQRSGGRSLAAVRSEPNGEPVEEDIIDSCGKMQVLHQMLKRLSKGGHKTLIFSQFTTILDIIAKSLTMRGYKYCQLDGRTALQDRQTQVEDFFTDPELKVFLLSTRAGGMGINLTAADTCIIYDSDWNPQQDLQAQDRCHRIGQTKPVVIYRLVTKNTIDESIVQRAQAKRAIEKLVVHEDKFKSNTQESLKQTSEKVLSANDIMQILMAQDELEATEEAKDGQYGLSRSQLDDLLDRSDIVKEFEEMKAKGPNSSSTSRASSRAESRVSSRAESRVSSIGSRASSRASSIEELPAARKTATPRRRLNRAPATKGSKKKTNQSRNGKRGGKKAEEVIDISDFEDNETEDDDVVCVSD